MMNSLKANNCFQIRNEKVTEASHRVNHQNAPVGAAHKTVGKQLCVADIAEGLLSEKSAKEITTMPLTNEALAPPIKC